LLSNLLTVSGGIPATQKTHTVYVMAVNALVGVARASGGACIEAREKLRAITSV
jgi:hypothetical protein